MTIFTFDVDADHARQNNELLKDARRLQISAVLFAAILVGSGVCLHRILGGVPGMMALGVLAVLALGSLALIVIIPRYVGDAESLYAKYPLCPAMIAKINSRDMVLLSLVNVNSDPDGAPRWALAARTVSRIEGHQRHTGERVPSVAVSSMEQQAQFREVTPMPIAWGTTDPTVIRTAMRNIPEASWDLLRTNMSRLDEVLATPRNLLTLD